MVEITCDYCGCKFKRQKKQVNSSKLRGMKIYCTSSCAYASRVTTVNTVCNNCGKPIKKHRSQINKSKSGFVYCSRSCATVANNTLYKSGDNHPNFSNSPRGYRKKALDYYGFVCMVCLWDDETRILQVHHIDGDRDNNRIENLIVICPNCHAKISFGFYDLVFDCNGVPLLIMT